MLIIPAIDIKDGKCVRLLQGRMKDMTVYSDKPAAMAKRWVDEGAQLLHIVDLDGAVKKKTKNLDCIKEILKVVDIPVQLGGGIRDIKTIEIVFKIGISKVIIGTEAIRNPQLVKDACKYYRNKIIVGIDAKKGMVAIEGWTATTDVTAVELAKQFEDCGVAAINFTDIHRDGMQTGPNIEKTRILAESVSIPVVASGGVSGIDDIKNLLPLTKVGVTGVIIGKALYSGSLELKEAIKTANTV
mmetsp:Transcript_13456/g.6604  ORF Transcript_13456/g.6604 Transcript_13456/m.6604 type:complete len:243 (-) Transcript_13456:1205-1933(-)